ncbi:MAG TPA: hypothetical protein PLQ76_03245, partial [bacterium]|nr:hypothetical protein [bacterium]
MKKPLDRMIVETWVLFKSNLVLVVPAVVVTCLTIAFYLFLGMVVFLNIFPGLKKTWGSFGGSMGGGSPELLMGLIIKSVGLLFGFMITAAVFQTFLGMIHGAGWGGMFANVVSRGRTDLGDYVEGIGKFSGRMFGYMMIRGGLVGLPFVVAMFFVMIFVLIARNATPMVIVLSVLMLAAAGVCAMVIS